MPRKKKTNRRRLERVSIRADRRPEPDWDRFAWALLQHTKAVYNKTAKAKPKDRPRS
jgi:hypothetical protein